VFRGLLVPHPAVKPVDAVVQFGADTLGFTVQESAQTLLGDGELAGEFGGRVPKCDESLEAAAGTAGVAPFAAWRWPDG
jgi:hypothetical protein